jgi:ATP-binding cassette subfamily F protein 3
MPGSTESQRRSRLAQFGLGFDKQSTTVANLSGGERARLLLNLVAMDAPHLLILDEPTNHLDIDSRRALLDALNDYSGAVLLITHDRSLMELVADRLWLAADGTIKPFEGDMDDYAKFVLDRAKLAVKPTQVQAAPEPTSAKAAPLRDLAPLRRKVEMSEKEMNKATRLLAELDHALADPELYKNPPKITELNARRERAQAAVERTEAEWMAAVEAYEAAQ